MGNRNELQTGGILLKLAKKQGMNTDIRRSIFVVLMGSDVSFHQHGCRKLVRLLIGMCARTMSMPVADWLN
jgi:hypothetical protein